jgi:hypothetical protein
MSLAFGPSQQLLDQFLDIVVVVSLPAQGLDSLLAIPVQVIF